MKSSATGPVANPFNLHITSDPSLKGVELVRRTEDEEPFAAIRRRPEYRLWSVIYRSPTDGLDPLGQPSVSFNTRKQAVAEVDWSARKASDYQLGLVSTP